MISTSIHFELHFVKRLTFWFVFQLSPLNLQIGQTDFKDEDATCHLGSVPVYHPFNESEDLLSPPKRYFKQYSGVSI